MGYILYGLSLACLIFATVLYLTRDQWTPYAPAVPYLTVEGPLPSFITRHLPLFSSTSSSTRPAYARVPGGSFTDDISAGLSSSNFDLAPNLEADDRRQGLDDEAKEAVKRIMTRRKCDFDEARVIWLRERMRRENVAEDGTPRDPKAVFFS
ncbi:MAG: hypothetical protein Q9165_004647 [Trypethelium subeluteriae]